jgi:molybdopterin-containing oxidoreductase family iron-sulfur binding subunit
VREAELAAFLANPRAGNEGHGGHGGKDSHPLSLWSGHEYKGHRWALAVDLSACTGCSACVVSCQAENNIPSVGRDEVLRGREMHWMRVDRYYQGDEANPQVVHQPMMCQHCENAPCETVCPVLATVHSSEGLNQQVYNRCVGTRYCANNCPTKVRRFNWFDYEHEDPVERMVLNPDVVVRSRGVMEKCSLCVQRVQEAKATANREGRPLRDGDVQTACQQSCPAKAIHFGDLNDPDSRVAKLAKDGRAFRLLEELNIGSSITYLTKIRNAGSGSGT